jgi:hypothetical protein
MSLFDDIRQAAPWAKDLTDRQILDKGVELTGLSPMEVAGYLGVSEKRGVLGAANDYAIEFANAVASLPKAAIDLVKPGTETSAAIGRFIEEGEKKQSLTAAEAKYQLNRSMQSEDLGEQAAGAFRYVKENPMLAASQALGSFVGPGAAIKGGKMIGGALGLTEKGVARAGLTGGSTAGAVLAGGDASGDAYQMVMNAPELQDLPIEERADIATRAARGAAPLPFIIGAASGLVGADKAFAAGTKSILRTTGAEAASEFVEEGATKLSANLAAGQAAPSIQPMTGVIGSATLGGLLGGGTGAVVGTLNRVTAPGSLLAGSTNISTGEATTPDGNAINKAIDVNSSEILVGPPPREAYVGPQVPEQAGPPVPSSAQVAAVQQAQAAQVAQQQAAQKQQEAQAAFDSISSTYGIQPTQVAGRYTVAGKTLFTQADATKFVTELDALNKNKTPEQKSLIGAVLSSGAIKVPLKSTAKSVNASAVKFLSDIGIDSSVDKVDAAERTEFLISNLEGPKALKEADELNNFYKALTGKDAPAFVALQQLASETTKGAKNEKQQLRVPTGVGAVPEQGRAAETSGGIVGPVRPDQVRPIGTGSNLILPSTVQNVGPGSVRTRVEPGTSGGDNAIPSVGQEQKAQVIPDDRLSALAEIRKIVESAFGTRDAGIVMEYLTGEKTSREIAKQYDVSDARVAQIAGPTAQETWGARILAAGKRLGYGKDEIYSLLEIASETAEDTETQTTTEEDLDFEAVAAREAAVSDESGPTMAEEAAMEAEGEQALGREETGEKEGGGASGFRVFNPQESGGTELEDASSANRTYQKFKKQGLQVLKDFELNNLAIDERTTDAELEAIVKEINRRQEVRVAKGEDNAVQKRSTKGVSVRKQAEAGKGVPSEDTEKRTVATKSKADEKGRSVEVSNALAIIDRAEKAKLSLNGIMPSDWQVGKSIAPGQMYAVAKRTIENNPDFALDVLKLASRNTQLDLAKQAPKEMGTLVKSKTENVWTLDEEAEIAWNTNAEKLGLFVYDALPEEAQQDWKDSVESGNISPRDMQTVFENNQGAITEADEKLNEQIDELKTIELDALEEHYGNSRESNEFFIKVKNDVAAYVNKGAQAVDAAIRSIIKSIANGLMAIAVVFNPAQLTTTDFDFPLFVSETRAVTMPAPAVAEMSSVATKAYEISAPAFVKANQTFFIADKPNGKIHLFDKTGKHIASSDSLYGKQAGDRLTEEQRTKPMAAMSETDKITPAGTFTVQVVASSEYAGGYTLHMSDKQGYLGGLAIHSVYTGNAKENRLGKLLSQDLKDKKISFGCINTSPDFFINKVLPKIGDMENAGVVVIPDAQDTLAQYIEPTFEEVTTPVPKTERRGAQQLAAKEEKPQFSKTAEGKKGSNAEALRKELKDFIGAENLRRLEIYQSIDDIPVNIRAIVNPTAEDQGFVFRSKAYLIADNIAEGTGRAVFMHEVGSHLGLQQMLTEKQFDNLVDTVTAWAAKDDNSVESRIAIKALERAAGVSDEQANTELIAYFIEEAVLEGINPTAIDLKTPIGRWFRTLWAAFKTALRRLNLFNPDKLSAEDVINLAYGAARLEIAGTWHGTAADFRKFSTNFIGTGEGQQAFGWGVYLAQRAGIAKGYFEKDVQNRNRFPTTTATYKGMNRNQLQIAMLDAELTDPEKYAEYQVARLIVDNESFVNGAKSKITQTQIDGYVEYEKKMLEGADLPVWDDYTQSLAVKAINEAAKDGIRRKIAAAAKMKASDFGPPPKGGEGNLMRVDINARSEELLDLDKPIKDQPYIYNILENLKGDAENVLQAVLGNEQVFLDQITGHDLYFGIKRLALNDPQWLLAAVKNKEATATGEQAQRVVSQFLYEQGIKGSQFADSKSRNLAYAAYTDKKDVDTKNITRNIIMFNDEDIFRVASLVGAEPERIQFSKARLNQARQAAAQQVAKLPKPIRGPLQQITDNIIDFAKKGLPFAAFTEDLADLAAKYLPSAKKYVQLVKAQQAIRTSLERRIDKILQQYDALPNEVKGVGENSVNAFIKDSTMKGEWGYDANIKGSKIDPELKARFDAFPAAAQNLIKEVFNHGRQTLKAMQDAVINNINTEYDALIAAAQKAGDVTEVAELTKKKANSLSEYRTLMRMGNKGPYAPLKRFGNYVVVGRSQAYLDQENIRDNPKSAPDQVAEANKKLRELEKNQDHYFVQFAETMGEAKAISRDEEANYALVEPFEKDSSRGALFGGADVQGLFYRLRNMVEDTQDSNTTDKSERAINRLLSDLHLSLLSEQSARQSEKRRRKIAGAEKDMMRAFATQGRATAHFISSLENSEEIYDSLRDMKKEADSRVPGRAERRRYYNEFMKRHVMGLDYEPSPFIDKALNTTSVWMLLTNPSYYLQNMTQPFMMSLPLVGAKHGYDKSWKEFTRAYSDIASVIRKHGLGEESYNKLPQDVRDVVEDLVNRGRIDISLEQDLGRWRSTEDSKLDKFGRATEYLRGIAQDIESINRVATAVAAYRLEARTNNKANAINYADSVIYRTHGDYSGFNAPRISRKGLGRLATQFRKFQLIQLSLMARLFNDAFAGQDADTRRIGRRALMFTIGHTAAMGGVMGLPGFAALSFLYGLVFGDEDEPDNPELAMRRAIGDDTLADLIVKGVPAALGVDLSGKLGMGQMLSILPYTDIDFSRKGVAEAGFALMTGPFGGLTLKAADGISLMGQGDYYKGLEQLMPTGVANAMKGYRFATEGVTSRRDDVLIPAEDISFAEAFMAGIGLPTKQLTDKQFLQNAKFEYEKFYNDKASEIKRAYARAYRSGVGLSDARNDWEELQQSRVRNGFKRQSLSVLLKAPQEQVARERSVVGGVQTNKANRGFVRQTSEL